MRVFTLPLPGCEADADRVNLTAYLVDPIDECPAQAPRRGAVLVCPGGGYQMLAGREGEPVALRFAAAGFSAFVLRYSIGSHAAFPQSLMDAMRAMRLIRQNADDWGVDPDKLAVCGFSAGGHLAASLGTLWNAPDVLEQAGCTPADTQPNALILGYPVITSTACTHGGSIDTLLQGHEAGLRPRLACENNVGPHTPPTFLFHTFMDDCVPVENALLFATALVKHDVPVELHIFENGGHGLALADAVTQKGAWDVDADVADWMRLCVNWLRHQFGTPLHPDAARPDVSRRAGAASNP